MADELIPDLASNLYSQGQVGTGYAQVIDLGAPNPFAVTQDYINQTVANKKEAVKKAVDNEEKRQQKLDEFLASVDDIDQPWNVAKIEIGNAINDYGDQIAKMRAKGTPIKSTELIKAQRNLKDLAKVNESNYQKAMKIGTEMRDPLIYTDEERAAFDEEIKQAANIEKGGGVNKVQEVLDKWQKGVETPNVVEDYKKIFKAQKQDQSPYLSITPEKGFKAAVNAQLESYKTPQLKKIFKEYQDGNRIPDGITIEDLDNPDESIRNTALEAIRTEMEKDLTPYKEVEKSAYTGSRASVDKKESASVQSNPTGDPSAAWRFSVPKSGQTEFAFDNGQGGVTKMTPLIVSYDAADGQYPEGYYIYGLKKQTPYQENRDTRDEANSYAQEIENATDDQGNPKFTDISVVDNKDGTSTVKYTSVEIDRVPYAPNDATMKSRGFEGGLEATAKRGKYKKLMSPSSNTSGGSGVTWTQ